VGAFFPQERRESSIIPQKLDCRTRRHAEIPDEQVDQIEGPVEIGYGRPRRQFVTGDLAND
jgi:hypothetical protein